jgi:hypothetical protein
MIKTSFFVVSNSLRLQGFELNEAIGSVNSGPVSRLAPNASTIRRSSLLLCPFPRFSVRDSEALAFIFDGAVLTTFFRRIPKNVE